MSKLSEALKSIEEFGASRPVVYTEDSIDHLVYYGDFFVWSEPPAGVKDHVRDVFASDGETIRVLHLDDSPDVRGRWAEYSWPMFVFWSIQDGKNYIERPDQNHLPTVSTCTECTFSIEKCSVHNI